VHPVGSSCTVLFYRYDSHVKQRIEYTLPIMAKTSIAFEWVDLLIIIGCGFKSKTRDWLPWPSYVVVFLRPSKRWFSTPCSCHFWDIRLLFAVH